MKRHGVLGWVMQGALLATSAALTLVGGCSSTPTACGGSGQACCATGAQCNSASLMCESGTCRAASGPCDFATPGNACMECLAAEAPDGCAASLRICGNNASCNDARGPLEGCLCDAGSDTSAAGACLGTFEAATTAAPELANCSTERCAGVCGR